MTLLRNGIIATDLDAHNDNAQLIAQGYTVRHVETFHFKPGIDDTCIIWDAPQITEADLPY